MKTAQDLSAVVSLRGDEAELAACLATLGFAAERIVVVDNASPKIKAVADETASRLVEGAFERDGERRQAGIDAATGPWILEIDSDDRVSADLAGEIVRTTANSTSDRHNVRVHNYIGDRLIRQGWGGAFGKGTYAGLFQKGTKLWGHERIHPTPRLLGSRGKTLKLPLRHNIGGDVSAMIARLNLYSTLHAMDLRDGWKARGKIDQTLQGNVWRSLGRFYKSYWRAKGYREGRWGLLIALMAALYPLLSFLKATLEDE